MINKKKICKECGREDYIWSKGKCKPCASKSYKPLSQKKGLQSKGRIVPSDKTLELKQKDIQYYQEKWATMPSFFEKDEFLGKPKEFKCCEECNAKLYEFSPSYISHIVARGANTALRFLLENSRLYCYNCHQRWEFEDKHNMKTFPQNQEIKQRLIKEYYLKGKSD